MANYANLLAQIAANIYSNNNQDITGDGLQAQLNAMVTSLGAGYQFMGMAHPADTPTGYADLRAFWLAGEAGTYANFGGLVLADGEVAVLKYDGNGWSKDVTGGASTELITRITGELATGPWEVGSIAPGSPHITDYASNNRIRMPELVCQADGDYTITCNNGYEFLIYVVGKITTATWSAKRVVSLVAGDVFRLALRQDPAVDYSSYTQAQIYAVAAAAGLKMVGPGVIPDIVSEINKIYSIAWFPTYNDVPNAGGYINSSGAVVAFGSSRYTNYIPIRPGETYSIKSPFIVDAACAAVYKADKTFSRAFTSADLSANGDLVFTAAQDEQFLRCAFQNTLFPKYVSFSGLLIPLLDNLEDGEVTFNTLSNLVKDCFSIKYPVTTDNTTIGYIHRTGTNPSWAGARSTGYLPIKKGISVLIFKPFIADDAAVALYDDNKSFVRSITASDTGTYPDYIIVQPEEDECYLRVSYLVANIPNSIYLTIDKSTYPDALFSSIPVISGGYIGREGNVISFPDLFAYTDYIELPAGINFKIVNKTVDDASFAIYNADKSVSRVILSSDISGQPFIIFSLVGDEKYVRATLRPGDTCDVWFDEIVTNYDLLKRIGTTQTNIEERANILAAFDNIVCVGDSLTFSQVYTALSASRQAKRPYPVVLGKLCGNDATMLARSGATAQACWEEFESQIVAKTNPLAIIYLGTNYGLTDTLDTDVIGNDPDNWSNNNIGCYCRFVQKFQSLGYKVLLLKCWATSGTGTSDLAHTNSAIRNIGQRFGCGVIDVPVSDDLKFHYYPDLSGYNGVHYNDLGYSWFASALIAAVSRMSTDEMKLIIPNA